MMAMTTSNSINVNASIEANPCLRGMESGMDESGLLLR
jgi:hypothetical protein